ncbi:MAG: ABC transporter ATP-binding protein [Clostridiales bacterium]|nr:ABC transporter ATP-binding protein [Clostridiales bacterium]
MEVNYVLECENIHKKFKKFALDIPERKFPQGFSKDLIVENVSGKTTLLNILSGIRLDYKGAIRYFGQYTDQDRENSSLVKERIGYTGPGTYYLPQWSIRQVSEISRLLFDSFHPDRFDDWCRELAIDSTDATKKVSTLSDGNRMKLMIAGVLARDTDLLLMDEPASPLDPLMRNRLCELIRDYLLEGAGDRTVFFSTHNIADMENVTDYAVIMADGRVVETGFVEDLKEKYILVKGEAEDAEKVRPHLFSMTSGRYGFEGICLSEKLDALAGCDVIAQTPTLSQISVAVMAKHSGRVS